LVRNGEKRGWKTRYMNASMQHPALPPLFSVSQKKHVHMGGITDRLPEIGANTVRI
jgi:hypothetical protein